MWAAGLLAPAASFVFVDRQECGGYNHPTFVADGQQRTEPLAQEPLSAFHDACGAGCCRCRASGAGR